MSSKEAKVTRCGTTPDGDKIFRVADGSALKEVADNTTSGDAKTKRVSEPATIYKASPATDGPSRTRERTMAVTPRAASVQLSAKLGCVVVMSPKKAPSVSRRTIRKAVETVAGKRTTNSE